MIALTRGAGGSGARRSSAASAVKPLGFLRVLGGFMGRSAANFPALDRSLEKEYIHIT